MIKKVNRKIIYIILVLALAVAIIMELLCLSTDVFYEVKGSSMEIYDSNEVLMRIYGYSNSDNIFIATDVDPRIVFDSVNYEVDSIKITFSNPIRIDTSIKMYYTSSYDEDFNEIHTIEGVIPWGVKEYYIDCQPMYIHSLRFDIDGNFTLDNIVLSDADMSVYEVPRDINIWRMLFLYLFAVIIMTTFYLWSIFHKTPPEITKFEILYCIFCGVFYFLWSISKPFNYAPDEYMRYEVSRFIFDNNRIPVGSETIDFVWGFSYAHLPTILCNLLSYIPMKIVGLFTDSSFFILIAARSVSVICGTMTVYFVIKTSKLMFRKPLNWVMVVMISMLPQFAFLSSYVNNDIVAMLGSAIILYSWCFAYKGKFNRKVAFTLAVGIIICALSYYNSYGWILVSILYFSSYYIVRKNERKDFIKYSVLISALVLVGISYVFIRHYVVYGDFLGFNVSEKYGEMYAMDGMKPSERFLFTFKGQGLSVIDMLFIKHTNWIELSYKSSIECFGYMSVLGNAYIYWIYGGIYLFALFVSLIYLIFALQNVKLNDIKAKTKYIIFYLCVAFSIIIPIILSAIYSWKSGYQPQGRYFITSLLGCSLLITTSVKIVISRFKNKNVQDAMVYFICCLLTMATISEFFVTYLPE